MTRLFGSDTLAAHNAVLDLAEAGVMSKRTIRSFERMCPTSVRFLDWSSRTNPMTTNFDRLTGELSAHSSLTTWKHTPSRHRRNNGTASLIHPGTGNSNSGTSTVFPGCRSPNPCGS